MVHVFGASCRSSNPPSWGQDFRSWGLLQTKVVSIQFQQSSGIGRQDLWLEESKISADSDTYSAHFPTKKVSSPASLAINGATNLRLSATGRNLVWSNPVLVCSKESEEFVGQSRNVASTQAMLLRHLIKHIYIYTYIYMCVYI